MSSISELEALYGETPKQLFYSGTNSRPKATPLKRSCLPFRLRRFYVFRIACVRFVFVSVIHRQLGGDSRIRSLPRRPRRERRAADAKSPTEGYGCSVLREAAGVSLRRSVAARDRLIGVLPTEPLSFRFLREAGLFYLSGPEVYRIYDDFFCRKHFVASEPARGSPSSELVFSGSMHCGTNVRRKVEKCEHGA